MDEKLLLRAIGEIDERFLEEAEGLDAGTAPETPAPDEVPASQPKRAVDSWFHRSLAAACLCLVVLASAAPVLPDLLHWYRQEVGILTATVQDADGSYAPAGSGADAGGAEAAPGAAGSQTDGVDEQAGSGSGAEDPAQMAGAGSPDGGFAETPAPASAAPAEGAGIAPGTSGTSGGAGSGTSGGSSGYAARPGTAPSTSSGAGDEVGSGSQSAPEEHAEGSGSAGGADASSGSSGSSGSEGTQDSGAAPQEPDEGADGAAQAPSDAVQDSGGAGSASGADGTAGSPQLSYNGSLYTLQSSAAASLPAGASAGGTVTARMAGDYRAAQGHRYYVGQDGKTLYVQTDRGYSVWTKE